MAESSALKNEIQNRSRAAASASLIMQSSIISNRKAEMPYCLTATEIGDPPDALECIFILLGKLAVWPT